VHSAAIALVPVVAEKSRVPFFIVGGALAAWAVIISVFIGLRKPSFPSGLPGERAVIAITVVLVLGAVSTAVLTSSAPAKKSGETEPTAKPESGNYPPETITSTPAAAPASTAPAPASTATTPASTATTPASTATAPAAPSAPGSATTTVPLSAVPNAIAFNTKTLTAKAGKVTIALTNSGALEHNVTIAQGATVLGATPTFTSGSRSVTLTLKPGIYTFYCSVPGHRAAGMEGTLKVT
jgi:plastocyanin